MNELFPIYLKLDQLDCLLLGAGPVGLEKLQAILANSPQANVKVIAEELSPEFVALSKQFPKVRIQQRSFADTDLEDIQVAILATNNPELNNHVRKLCSSKRILLNVADKPSLCDFYLGSVVQKGNLKIGISTNGKSPTIAKRVKELLNELLPEEIDATLDLMADLRNQLKGDLKEKIIALNAHTERLVKNS